MSDNLAVIPTASIDASDLRAELRSADVTVRFMLAGDAHVTFQSEKTGVRFTFNVVAAPPGALATNRVSHFVKVLTGPDHYEYLGCIYESRVYKHGVRSKISASAKSAVAFTWCWSKLTAGRMPEVLAVYHEGRCGACGRRLTTPESIETGLGPVCAKKLGGGQ